MRTQTVIDRAELEKMCKVLEDATTMENLKAMFFKAIKWATKLNDGWAITELTAAKNRAKDRLSKEPS